MNEKRREDNAPDVTSLFDRVVQRSNDVLADPLVAMLFVPSVQVLTQGLASDGHDVAIDELEPLKVRENA